MNGAGRSSIRSTRHWLGPARKARTHAGSEWSLWLASDDDGRCRAACLNRRALDSHPASAGGESCAWFYVTGHPLASYADCCKSSKAVKSLELPNLTSGVRVSLGGIINDLQPRTTKKGDRFALLRLEDEAGGTKCVLWPETYRKYSAAGEKRAAGVGYRQAWSWAKTTRLR